VGDEHGHGLLDQPRPAVTAGVVGDLLVDETGEHRRPQVHVPRLRDAAERQALPRRVERAHRRRERLGRRCEIPDRALEEQLIASDIIRAELDETAGGRHQQRARIGHVERLRHAIGELGGRPAEHGVVDRVLRIEVGVHSWRRDAGPSGKLTQRQRRKPLRVHELPGGVHDRVASGTTSRFTPVDRRQCLSH
jgi:hypothetical protein